MIFIVKGFRTIAFIFIVISTTFRPICPPTFFRCLPNSGPNTELRRTFFIESFIEAMKVYFAFPWAPGLEPHYQMQFIVLPRHSCEGWFLSLCRGAFGVLSCPRPHGGVELGHVISAVCRSNLRSLSCFDVAQGRMNGAPNETQTHLWWFASLAC